MYLFLNFIKSKSTKCNQIIKFKWIHKKKIFINKVLKILTSMKSINILKVY